jgi:hypothetical protein
MRRVFLLLFLVVGIGCVANTGSRVGTPPNDVARVVHDALNDTALKSIEKHLVGDGWVPFKSLHGSGGSSRERCWHTHFACQRPGEFPVTKVWKLPEADYARVLTPIRADVLAVLEKTGVEIGTATPVELTKGEKATARFEITYVRRGGEVAGVVEGMLGPQIRTSGPGDEFLDLVVRVREWYTR